MEDVYILSAARTPIGSFGGCLASLSAVELASIAIKGALEKSGLEASEVEEVLMGNVISANLGQAPARQAALAAGIGQEVPCTTVNKVCSSGMKSIMLAAQSIALGQADVVVAGGMESMSNVPYYLPKARYGHKYGHGQLVDGLQHDGLWEAYHHFAMGNCADHTAKEMGISREAQDDYAIRSYTQAGSAAEAGRFAGEIVPVTITPRKGDPVIIAHDEEVSRVSFEKLKSLRPAFSPEGTVTAANASNINDGASAVVLISKRKAKEYGLKPIMKVLGYADAARDPLWFTTAPALAIPKAMKMAGIGKEHVDYYEINEAFSAVALANIRLLEIDQEKVNIYGGAVALGHPLGCSGARIVTTLTSVLRANDAHIGVAGICNGGGGASAMVIERYI